MQTTDVDFEKGLERLQEIVARLERGDLPLGEGVALFKEGLSLVRSCRKQLESAKNEVMVFQEGLLKEFAVTPDGQDGMEPGKFEEETEDDG